jgi:hypothetical protein
MSHFSNELLFGGPPRRADFFPGAQSLEAANCKQRLTFVAFSQK